MLENNSNSKNSHIFTGHTLADPKYFHELLHELNTYRGHFLCGTESWSFKTAHRSLYGNLTENKTNTVSQHINPKGFWSSGQTLQRPLNQSMKCHYGKGAKASGFSGQQYDTADSFVNENKGRQSVVI